MRLPLVLYQAGRWHDVCVGLGIGWAGRVAAMLRIVAVRILRPQPVDYEAQITSTFRAVSVGRTELRRPGKVQQVEVELPGRGLLLRTTAAPPAALILSRVS